MDVTATLTPVNEVSLPHQTDDLSAVVSAARAIASRRALIVSKMHDALLRNDVEGVLEQARELCNVRR